LRAARANFVPGLIIQTVMIAVVVAYYFHPPTRAWLGLLAQAKQNGGIAFTICATFIAGAVLPELLNVLTFQRGKFRRENWNEFLFLAVFWTFNGLVVDGFYHLQVWWFGAQVSFATVAKKVFVDEFLYNPLVAGPFGMFCYEWKNQHYATAGMARAWTWTFYKNKTIPALFATWVVWIPVTGAIYSLPPLLQMPIFSLALTFWVMMFAYITAGGKRRQQDTVGID
jgi:hypothetical protein